MFRVKLLGTLDLGGPDRDGRRNGVFRAECEIEVPFQPAVGMYLGPTNAVRIEEVYWVGYSRFECVVSFWNSRGPISTDHLTEYEPDAVMRHLTHGVKTEGQYRAHNTLLLPWNFKWEE